MSTRRLAARLTLGTFFLMASTASVGRSLQKAESDPPTEDRELVVEPARLELDAGDTAQLSVRVVAADGTRLEERVLFYSRARRSVTVDQEGRVEALQPGEYTIIVRTRRAPRESTNEGEEEQEERPKLKRLSLEVPVTVRRLPLAAIEIEPPAELYADSVIELEAVARDTRGAAQADVELTWASHDSALARFDDFGRLHLLQAGSFSVSASAEDQQSTLQLESLANPVRELRLSLSEERVRTGDVVAFNVETLDAAGVAGPSTARVPVEIATSARLDEEALAPAASGQVRALPDSLREWRFVAEAPGLYTIVATCGGHVARASVRVDAREYDARIELVGRGSVHETHTSDLWVWEGADGRDYVVTGTWGGDGEAIFWDVTQPSDIERIATLQVDARTVNDVKVSADGSLCVISREGASNRKNGIVLIDVSKPSEPVILGSYDEGLTGGVHNLFIDGQHVYALSNGRRYDIIDVSDPKNPRTIGSYELETAGHAIHDVWVEDGLAYSSNWSDGVHIVDVGNGVRGGSPSEPVFVGSYAYPSGWNHAAFPYHDSHSGRTYVVAGDEAFPYGLNLKDKPTYARGWLHFIDFTDMENPLEVARYQVPEAGTHNFWIENDRAYVAYYNGGLRVVDLSGELMGDLYRQGREMAFFLPADPQGHIANAPMVWGPQPHKGNVFFSDWNSGLWCVRLVTGPEE